MLIPFLLVYCCVLLGAFLATVALIVFGMSWGNLPVMYLRLIERIQNFFPKPVNCTRKEYKDSPKDFGRQKSYEGDSMSLSVENITDGLSAIIEGDLASAFDHAPSDRETLLYMKHLNHWSAPQIAVFYVCLLFRISFLLPIRFLLLLTSFVFVFLAGVFASIKKLDNRERTWVAIIYCRLFCSGIGLIAKFHNPQNRPRRPGVAVANHLTPNDIQILFSGTPHGSQYGYVVTGQKHHGVIGIIERLVEKLCPSLWLERKCSNNRQSFLADVLKIALKEGPVLLFPEGYCSNNTQVLQFRKAIFEGNVNIYPIAIRQNADFGDGFWFEDKFHHYLLRSMTSWAIVYDIQYLERQMRYDDESNVEFAGRIQSMIAEAADLPCSAHGGVVWYRLSEREKLLAKRQATNAARVQLGQRVHKRPLLIGRVESSPAELNFDQSIPVC